MAKLDRYLARRDFEKTNEPRHPGAATGLALRYAMQKHAATRTHFDLRLEWEGVLLSWAVTKGPSLDPSEKRLAVRTEDHPLSYLGFEGQIPEGNYGAGTVMLFDLGWWEPLEAVGTGLGKGHLRLRLHGQRLTGRWHLVRMQDRKDGRDSRENWLVIKEDDEAARRRDPVARYRRSVSTHRTFGEIRAGREPQAPMRTGRLPHFRKVQLATLEEEVASGEKWWHELKFDGYRALVALGKGGPRIFTRNGHDWTGRFAGLLPAFDELVCDDALIDGEIVAGAGLQGFSNLQKAIKVGGPFRFYGFDLLSLNGADLSGRSLAERREALEKLFKPLPPLGPADLSPIIREAPEDALATVCGAGGEGLISKRHDLPYRAGRSRGWLKVKCARRDEFVILGWQKSEKRGRPFASLAVGARRNGALVYLGKVGTGFDAETMDELAAAMRPRARKTPPADIPAGEARGVQWIRPDLVAEVQYAEMTAEGRLRHGVFLGLREDKPAKTVKLAADRADTDARTRIAGVSVSSPERIVYPGAGVTKREVAEYYEAVAERMLATAADRPVSLMRLPEGLHGERFFQKHRGQGFPGGIGSVTVRETDGHEADYMYISTVAGLVGAAQMGTLEFHIRGARRDRLERPDRMVFDLDPDEGLDFAKVSSAAVDIRDRLRALGLPCWPLLTGGKGVHVVVPLRRIAGWDTVKLYARIFAQVLAITEPRRFTHEMSKAKRKGRIFIDWLRNERGATAIAPFSLRARPGAPVAVPVSWAELPNLKSADAFDMTTAVGRTWETVDLPDPVGLSKKRVDALEAWNRSVNG